MTVMDNAFALVVGIANYENINKLPPTVLNDAQAIYELLIDSSHCGYSKNSVILLKDRAATKLALSQALKQLAQQSNQESTIFIYISSHGGQVEHGPNQGEYLLPVDADFSSGSTVAESAISGTDFTEALKAISARKVVVVFDCCHSGGIGQPKDADAPILKTGFSENYYDVLKEGKGRVILASSRSSEYSYVMPGANNSIFTKHLLAGIKGGISSDNGLIKIFDLFEYLQPKVTGENSQQHPIFKAEIEENFPIALYLGGKKGVVQKDQQGFLYDAYISYVDTEPDSTWVWDELIPKLEDAGCKLAVSGDVEEPGVARVVNIERGMKQAKRTVIVISEAYLLDNMAEFENTLVQTMGIQEGNYRLLPIKSTSIDNIRLPTRLSMLSTLDLSHPRRAEREFKRLIKALKNPLPKMG
ncbi:MAG: caspase family protein [Cyanobacteria bacterium J06558_2]